MAFLPYNLHYDESYNTNVFNFMDINLVSHENGIYFIKNNYLNIVIRTTPKRVLVLSTVHMHKNRTSS